MVLHPYCFFALFYLHNTSDKCIRPIKWVFSPNLRTCIFLLHIFSVWRFFCKCILQCILFVFYSVVSEPFLCQLGEILSCYMIKWQAFFILLPNKVKFGSKVPGTWNRMPNGFYHKMVRLDFWGLKNSCQCWWKGFLFFIYLVMWLFKVDCYCICKSWNQQQETISVGVDNRE